MANPFLKDLPFKIELNRWGRIEMSPASNQHGRIPSEIARALSARPGGVVDTECRVQTTDGLRVAEVAWISDERLAEMGELTPFPHAPEICIEIVSPSNSWAAMQGKAGLYLEAVAHEVWLQTLDGQRSAIAPPPSAAG